MTRALLNTRETPPDPYPSGWYTYPYVRVRYLVGMGRGQQKIPRGYPGSSLPASLRLNAVKHCMTSHGST